MDTNEVDLRLFLGQQNDDGDTDGLEETARALLSILEDMDVESATLLRTQDYLPFAKGSAPISGGLHISVRQGMLPGLMEFLHTWLSRNQGYRLQAIMQRGDLSVEVVYTGRGTLSEIRKQRAALKQLLEE
ncbi:MAG TPA: hypothetical protein VGF67_29500 [Ktedonobacteraceae bacterium]|jgi:hypothetical protein